MWLWCGCGYGCGCGCGRALVATLHPSLPSWRWWAAQGDLSWCLVVNARHGGPSLNGEVALLRSLHCSPGQRLVVVRLYDPVLEFFRELALLLVRDGQGVLEETITQDMPLLMRPLVMAPVSKRWPLVSCRCRQPWLQTPYHGFLQAQASAPLLQVCRGAKQETGSLRQKGNGRRPSFAPLAC